MRYYTMRVETTTDGTENREIRGFDTFSEALSRYHTDLAKYVNNTGSILESLITSDGNMIKVEKWEAEATATDDTTEQTTEDTSEEA